MTAQRERKTIRHSVGTATSFAIAVLVACGPPAVIGPEPNEPRTEPEAQGVAEHRRDAQLEAARLAAHREEYDPRARETQRRCDSERPVRKPGQPICWYETINPTDVHLEEIEAHRLHAAYHRKAARELTGSERRACEGVARVDREQSPFAHRADILGVTPLEESTGSRPRDKRLAGATVLFRQVPGLTGEVLQRVMDCHIAQNAALGYEQAQREQTTCPLTQRGVQAAVRQVNEGFAVDVRSEDPAAAQNIWQRAQALATVEK